MSLPRKLSKTMLKQYKQGILTAGINILTFYNFLWNSMVLVQNTPNGHPGFLFDHMLQPTPFSILFKKQPVLQKEDCTTEATHFPFLMPIKGGTRKWNSFNLSNFPQLLGSEFALLRTCVEGPTEEPAKTTKSSECYNHSFTAAKRPHPPAVNYCP